MANFRINIGFSTVRCSECQALFALPDETDHILRDSGKSFWCPTCGQRQHYVRPRIPELENKVENLNHSLRRQYANITELERSVAARKGQITKLKKAIAAGACPCCGVVDFGDLPEHIRINHPNFIEVKK